jgi:hypothetical protein
MAGIGVASSSFDSQRSQARPEPSLAPQTFESVLHGKPRASDPPGAVGRNSLGALAGKLLGDPLILAGVLVVDDLQHRPGVMASSEKAPKLDALAALKFPAMGC